MPQLDLSILYSQFHLFFFFSLGYLFYLYFFLYFFVYINKFNNLKVYLFELSTLVIPSYTNYVLYYSFYHLFFIKFRNSFFHPLISNLTKSGPDEITQK